MSKGEVFKLFALFGLLLMVCHAGEAQKKPNPDECEKIPALKDALETCATEEQQQDEEFLQSDKCLRKCIQKYLGYYDENGKLDKKPINVLFAENLRDRELVNQIVEITNKCIEKTNETDNDCEIAWALSFCVKNNPTMEKIKKDRFCEDNTPFLPFTY